MKTLLVALLVITASGLYAQFTGKPRYELTIKRADTVMGTIGVELFPTIAPNHVRNWDSLVTIGFYDSVAFHRVIPGFMIQGGDPNTRSGPRDTWGYGGSETTVDAEFSAVSHRRGILSAARNTDPNSATSHFFICVSNALHLDREYSVYGKVTSGMDVVDAIVSSETDDRDNPLDKISMFVVRTGSNDSLTARPTLVSPVMDSMIGSGISRVTFRWNKIRDAMMYRVQLGTDPTFATWTTDTTIRQVDTVVAINKLASGKEYYWRVSATNGGDVSAFSEPRKFTLGTLSVESSNTTGLKLDDAYPNPARHGTQIGFYLEHDAAVHVSVLDLLGRTVLTPIAPQQMTAGYHEAMIDVTSLPAGTYLYRLSAGAERLLKRLIVE